MLIAQCTKFFFRNSRHDYFHFLVIVISSEHSYLLAFIPQSAWDKSRAQYMEAVSTGSTRRLWACDRVGFKPPNVHTSHNYSFTTLTLITY